MNREKIIRENMGLIKSIAGRYGRYGAAYEDLVQEGIMGMLNALEKFDESKGAKFSTYSVYFIKGRILDYLRRENKIKTLDMDIGENEEIEYRPNGEDYEPEREPETGPPQIYSCIPDDEKEVLYRHYRQMKTLKEIAEEMNISREKVRQLKQKALRRIKINKKLTERL
ncbi:MAG: sigma-70 family RNA polymerase sigma factor [Candidatus Goldiibacteriota bacterium]